MAALDGTSHHAGRKAHPVRALAERNDMTYLALDFCDNKMNEQMNR